MPKKNLIPVLILVAVGFSLYAVNLNNKLFWDDDDWIINNPAVHSLSWENVKFWFTHNTLAGIGMKSNYYRPFLFFTFAVNYVIDGIKPFGYHLLSNLIHIGNTILVFSILYSVFKRRLVAFLTALFFLIHPLQTEAVTYVSGRGDSLVVLFMLLSLLFFLKSYSTPSQDVKWKRGILLGFSLGSLILALLSRETAIIFPLLLMVFYIAFLYPVKSPVKFSLKEFHGGTPRELFDGVNGERFLRSLKTVLVKALPYFAVVFTYGILRLTVLNFKNVLNFYDQPNIYSSHLYVRIFTFLKTLLVYFKLLIVPTGLHMERGMDPQLSLWNWPVLLGGLIILGLIFLLVYFYRKNSNSLNPKPHTLNPFSVWFFGVGWFFVALAPVSGITPINALIYEHWLYLPMIGFWFIAAFYLEKIFAFFKQRKQTIGYWLLAIGCVGFLSFFAAQSVKRNILWGNPIPFYEDILKYEPDSVRINNNIGNMYYNEGNIAKAEEHYRKAVAEEDIFPQPHFNLGSILQAKGDIFGAVQEYKKAIELDPGFYYAYQNLVALYAKQGDLTLAAENIEKLKQLRPNDARILYNTALIYATMGKRQLALENAQQGLNFVGSDQEIKVALEQLLASLKK